MLVQNIVYFQEYDNQFICALLLIRGYQHYFDHNGLNGFSE